MKTFHFANYFVKICKKSCKKKEEKEQKLLFNFKSNHHQNHQHNRQNMCKWWTDKKCFDEKSSQIIYRSCQLTLHRSKNRRNRNQKWFSQVEDKKNVSRFIEDDEIEEKLRQLFGFPIQWKMIYFQYNAGEWKTEK